MAVQARSSPKEERLQLAAAICLVVVACFATAIVVMADTINHSGGGGTFGSVCGTDSGQNGFLVDGWQGGTYIDDNSFTAGFLAGISIGNFTAPPGEIIGFSWGGSPTIKKAPDPNDPNPFTWTPGDDPVPFTFENPVFIDIYGWIITGYVAKRKAQAITQRFKTEELWFMQQQGICIRSFTTVDMTQDPDVQDEGVYDHQTLNFNCGTVPSIIEALSGRQDVAYNANAINVFYVANVHGEGPTNPFGPDYGLHCPGSPDTGRHLILMGDDTKDNLLAHELGHALSLGEANDSLSLCPATLSLSCTRNVMHPATWSRQYLTEGQTFRAMVNTGSAINEPDFYNLRAGLEKRTCTDDAVSTTCPDIATRIWPEP